MDLLVSKIVDAVESARKRWSEEAAGVKWPNEGILRDQQIAVVEQVLRDSLFLAQFSAGLLEVSAHLDHKAVMGQKELSEIIANMQRTLAAFR